MIIILLWTSREGRKIETYSLYRIRIRWTDNFLPTDSKNIYYHQIYFNVNTLWYLYEVLRNEK